MRKDYDYDALQVSCLAIWLDVGGKMMMYVV